MIKVFLIMLETQLKFKITDAENNAFN